MKKLTLLLLFILSVSVLSADATSSSQNGFIVTSNQFDRYVHTTIFDTKRKFLELIITSASTGDVISRRTFTLN